jgi:hypothetical protein
MPLLPLPSVPKLLAAAVLILKYHKIRFEIDQIRGKVTRGDCAPRPSARPAQAKAEPNPASACTRIRTIDCHQRVLPPFAVPDIILFTRCPHFKRAALEHRLCSVRTEPSRSMTTWLRRNTGCPTLGRRMHGPAPCGFLVRRPGPCCMLHAAHRTMTSACCVLRVGA